MNGLNLPTWTIKVDHDRCAGSGLCCVYAPATFDIDDEAKSYVKNPAGDGIDAVRTAADACPLEAISLVQDKAMSEPTYTAPDFTLVGDEHVRRYIATNGEVGHEWNGASCLILTTTGRRTGMLRSTPLIYGQVDEGLVVIASQGGAPRHPHWYRNLSADPEALVQVRGDRFLATARDANDAERPRLWRLMTSIWPNYDVYATRTTRHIPVVVLQTHSHHFPPRKTGGT